MTEVFFFLFYNFYFYSITYLVTHYRIKSGHVGVHQYLDCAQLYKVTWSEWHQEQYGLISSHIFRTWRHGNLSSTMICEETAGDTAKPTAQMYSTACGVIYDESLVWNTHPLIFFFMFRVA